MPAGGFCASRHLSLKDRSVPVQPNPVQQNRSRPGASQAGPAGGGREIYEDVLAADKAHVAALHCLGGLAYQMGNLERAVTLIAEAVRINPRIAAADACRGAALNRLDRHNEALAVCKTRSGSSRILPKLTIIAAMPSMAWDVRLKPWPAMTRRSHSGRILPKPGPIAAMPSKNWDTPTGRWPAAPRRLSSSRIMRRVIPTAAMRFMT